MPGKPLELWSTKLGPEQQVLKIKLFVREKVCRRKIQIFGKPA